MAAGKTITTSYEGNTFFATDEANFAGATFVGDGGNFRGAVFEVFADFSDAQFYGNTVDFTDAVFLAGASFENVQFGKDYQRIFGDWEIRFSKEGSSYQLETRKTNEPEKEWRSLEIPGTQNIHELLKSQGIENDGNASTKAFNTFKSNPESISFTGCRFGAIELVGFSPEQIKVVSEKEKQRIRYQPGYEQNLRQFKSHDFSKSSDIKRPEYSGLMGILARHLKRDELKFHGTEHDVSFINAKFHAQADISFENSVFLNSGYVKFFSATFSNSGSVSFYSATFSNNEYVSFDSATFSNSRHVSFDSATFSNSGDVYFLSATFSNSGDVYFYSATFSNSGEVSFSPAIFSNSGDVSFDSATFSNSRDVYFSSATFSNSGNVSFDSATFSNSEDVSFSSATFSNSDNVSFDSATFSNNGNINFPSATFRNNGHVSFKAPTFSNKGTISLAQIIWANDGSLHLTFKEFRETLALKFDECLFLSKGGTSFMEARFPEKGSLMFQRCYFGNTENKKNLQVDFTGAFFRHSSFEGGEISWLKKDEKDENEEDRIARLGDTYKSASKNEQDRLRAEDILKNRLKEKYATLSELAKSNLTSRVTLVFEEGVEVLWKDLTSESAKNITLRRVNLSHSIFDGMTLSHIQLNAPEWLRDGERRILFEEKKLLDSNNVSEFDWRNIEDQYTQLKNNLEKQGNYLHAGYFHYGEQETRRRIAQNNEETHTFNYRLSTSYRWLSGYGEKPERALKVSLGLLLAFSLILSISTEIYFLFKTHTCLDTLVQRHGAIGFLGKCFAKFFGALVEIMTPFSWKSSESLKQTFTNLESFPFRMFFLIIFQFFMLAIQTPLLVLAIRRRFKR